MLEICLFIFVVTAVFEIVKMMWPQLFANASRVRKEISVQLKSVFVYSRYSNYKKAQEKYVNRKKPVFKSVSKKAELKVLLSPSSLDMDRTEYRKQRNKSKAA